jgi:transcriptional regulator with XRE-family HTH domain
MCVFEGVDRAEEYRHHAAEVRSIAASTIDLDRKPLLLLAESYEHLARTISDSERPKPEPGKAKRTNSTDAYVGNRIRLRRMLIGMSQERLGELLGLTFQQIQKYEKGINRIAAGRLYDVAGILRVPVSFFFEDAEANAHAEVFSTDKETPPVVAFMSNGEGLELIVAFTRIKDVKVRRRVLELVRQLAEPDSTALPG